jgi:signal transduction histidine kinase
MRRLPRLVYGSHLWELPLADCSASALEEALLAPSLPACQARLERLLKEDPAVLLWTVCQGDLIEEPPLSTCRLAAEWLGDHLLTLLDWSTEPEGEPTVVPSDIAERFARLAGVRVATAKLARQLAETTADVCPDEAELAGLLLGAAAWGEGTTDNAVAGRLPKWIAAQRSGGGRAKPRRADRGGPWHIAARAAAICHDANADAAESEPSGPTPKQPDALGGPDVLSDLHRTVVSRWLECDAAVYRRLPPLVTKLRQLETLERQFQTELEAEKLEAMKELAYGAGHEINNPLANISVRAQTLIKQETDPERRRKLAAINSQAFRAHEMIADLMLFARPPKLQPELIDLTELVDTVIQELAADAQTRGTTFEHRRPAGPVKIMGDPVQLAVALRALAVNSLEALGSGGQVCFEAHPAASRPPAPWAKLVVTDTGPGIKEEIRRHLFDPFFSGREAGRGLGFGLSKCWRIVTDHGGQIVVDSPQGGGATFTLYLPVAQKK